MYIRKKLSILLLAIMLISTFILGGCSKASEPTTNETKNKKVIKVGTAGEYYPWCFKKDNKLQGFEIDVWNEIGKRSASDIEFKVSKFSGLFGMLDSQQIDTVAHQISTTEDRRKKYDFSDTYAYSEYEFVVKKDSTMNKLEDFKGKKIGCVLGGNGEKTLRMLNEKNNLNLEIVAYDGTPMEKDVEIGRLDAAWLGLVKAKTTIEQGNLNLKLAETETGVYEVNQYPFIKNEKNKEVIKEVNKALKSMHEDGTLSKISEKWFDLDTTKKK
ncbi:amino acid ABC transporter amino acid-binding protein YxeM [Gottschalkia purinilytica]|uniref:Amino acid ABC transporter amino acid-binding protein YxeM n=1 Tax=Gottschalkia purinilytica TaxID=1503 RepID=A0A0L0WFB5_GOTPU|nr:transporter substrate-binding domain-containing protein [Gottschalkia purinilytica]KNF10177.1 amino acid ABC transporter amino acid-binding protein YxeM [Gottschalkia purinilytica]